MFHKALLKLKPDLLYRKVGPVLIIAIFGDKRKVMATVRARIDVIIRWMANSDLLIACSVVKQMRGHFQKYELTFGPQIKQIRTEHKKLLNILIDFCLTCREVQVSCPLSIYNGVACMNYSGIIYGFATPATFKMYRTSSNISVIV